MKEQDRLRNLANKWIKKLDEMLEHAKNASFSELNEHERFLRLIKEFGSNSSEDFMGTEEAPTTIYASNVFDNKVCDHCQKSVQIYHKDVPNILMAYKSLSNGIAHPFRSLIGTYGLQYQKLGDGVFRLFGFVPVRPEEKYPDIPNKVQLYFAELVQAGIANCEHCNKKLLIAARNWNIDHKHFDVSYAQYNTDEEYRNDILNYQLLCLSCNCTKREEDKKKRQEN